MAGFDGEAMPEFFDHKNLFQATQVILARQFGQYAVLASSISHTDASLPLLIKAGPRRPGSLSCNPVQMPQFLSVNKGQTTLGLVMIATSGLQEQLHSRSLRSF